MENTPQTGIVILAAGASARLGEPKQLVRFEGESLLRRIVKTALAASIDATIVVVLGARIDVCRKELSDFDVEIAENADWEKGLSGSISVGLTRLLNINPKIQSVLLVTCDQPFLTTEIINQMVEKYKERKPLIVACQYADTLGVPALFDEKLFARLKNLKTKGGAKKLIEKFYSETIALPFPDGIFDVDTQEDFLNLKKLEFGKVNKTNEFI